MPAGILPGLVPCDRGLRHAMGILAFALGVRVLHGTGRGGCGAPDRTQPSFAASRFAFMYAIDSIDDRFESVCSPRSYVVIEGWREAQLTDPELDALLADDKVADLRRFRNQVPRSSGSSAPSWPSNTTSGPTAAATRPRHPRQEPPDTDQHRNRQGATHRPSRRDQRLTDKDESRDVVPHATGLDREQSRRRGPHWGRRAAKNDP